MMAEFAVVAATREPSGIGEARRMTAEFAVAAATRAPSGIGEAVA
jgi:hypothetical protein